MNLLFIPGFLIGAMLGSLVKALADRSLKGDSFFGRSKCTFCKKIIHWYDLVPVLSFLFLKGRCRFCKVGLSIEYLLSEVILGALIAFLFWQSGQKFFTSPDYLTLVILSFDFIFKIFIVVVLSILFLTDLKKTFIPDKITYPSVLIALLFLVIITGLKIFYLYLSLNQTMVGQLLLPPHSDYFQRHALSFAEPLILGILMAFLIGLFFFSLIFATNGKGMGGGDLKLGIFIGLVFGFPNSVLALILSFILGSLVGVLMIIFGKRKFGQTIPFGPFLSTSAIITLFWGKEILDWYFHLSL